MLQNSQNSMKNRSSSIVNLFINGGKEVISYLRIGIKTIKEYGQLAYLRGVVGIKELTEYTHTVLKYYGLKSFRRVDSFLVFSYLFKTPFKVSKEFQIKQKDDDIYTYGETPLTTLQKISKECRLERSDTVLELGCGRGRTCFWLNAFIGCKVVGVDHVPDFIGRANLAKEKFDFQDVEFRCSDLLTTSYGGASAVYLYGTCYSPEFIQQLADHLEMLPKGAKVITVSYALTEFAPKAPFEVMRRFTARFTWGEADVFLQIRK